ncbi:hypothetical protein FRB99_007357 [Tulasnella sp. 403]|nr:hypothetical protein FRB99_007357 [Tulasnella sp. 403]
MDDIEDGISRGVSTISGWLEKTLIGAVRLATLPIILPLKLVKVTIPPALHIAIFLSLLPLLGLFSISAGYLVSKWLPSGWSEPVYLIYGRDPTPYAYTELKNLKHNQPYDISVHLTIPTSPSNYELGNFMSLLIPPSGPLRMLTPSLATVIIPLFDSFLPGYSSLRAKLEVGRPDSWKQIGKGEGKELAVVETFIKGAVKPTGLMALLTLSPTMTSIITSVTFFFTATFIALALYLAFSPSFSVSAVDGSKTDVAVDSKDGQGLRSILRPPSQEIKTEPDADPITGERRPRRRRSRRSPSVSSSEGTPGMAGSSAS